jgi:hypothetical protein
VRPPGTWRYNVEALAPDLPGDIEGGHCTGRQHRLRRRAHLSRPAVTVREHLARQGDKKFGKFIHLAIDSDRSAMLLRDDVVGDRQAESGALAGWFGREERLE